MDQQLHNVILGRRVITQALYQVIPDFLNRVFAITASDKLIGLGARTMLLTSRFVDKNMPVAVAVTHTAHGNVPAEVRASVGNAIPERAE